MPEVIARPLSSEAFAPYGVVRDLVSGGDGVVTAQGDGWFDSRTESVLLAEPGHLGLTEGSALPHDVASMERHLHTREALFCLDQPVVLPVARLRADSDRPHTDDVEAFLIEPGQVVELHVGVWHDACHGIAGRARYYWYATEVEGISNDWIELDAGPVTVRAVSE